MSDAPEEFRYLYPSSAMSFVFRAVSIEDAVAYTRLHFCPNATERTAQHRLQCYVNGEWIRVQDYLATEAARTA